jgi:hypothetical protein
MGGGRIKGKGAGECMCWKYYIVMFENGKARLPETILRMRKGGIKDNNGGVEFN